MIGARQSIGHMTVGGHPTNLDVWSVTVHLKSLFNKIKSKLSSLSQLITIERIN